MTTITITFSTAITNRVIDGICNRFNYDPSTGETKAAFAKRMVIKFAKDSIQESELQTAVNATRTQVIASVESDIIFT